MDASGPRITVADTQSGRRYVARLADYPEQAELELSRVNASLMIAAHTGVPPSLAGRGVGEALVQRLVADAREEDFAIVPLCPFVTALYRKNPDWADVMKG